MESQQMSQTILRLKQKLAIAMLLSAALSQSIHGQTYTLLDTFDGTNGAQAGTALVQGSDGNLYGVTAAGGASDNGTVFSVSPNGTLATIYNFCVLSGCPDGSYPTSVLLQSPDGTFYGTTQHGGAHGRGTIFSITTAGVLTTVYSFCALPNCRDGSEPMAGVIRASNGNLVGTTFQGGAHNGGTVFEMKPGGGLTTIYNFCETGECTDGLQPETALVEAWNGDLYGTTASGGNAAACFPTGCGTVFEMTLSGALTTIHAFSGPDGASPLGALIQARDGNLYGTTSGGGAGSYGPGGTVFRISRDGVLKKILDFCNLDYCEDGSNPQSSLVEGTDGNLYGTTPGGGPLSAGSIYSLTSSGTLTTLYGFSCMSPEDCGDGWIPNAGLTQDTNGVFYGLAYYGGADGEGVIFSLSNDLGPFVELIPDAGSAGKSVEILGTGLTEAEQVSFNGTVATFQVLSDSLIEVTVPANASSGRVTVRNQGGGVRSKVLFRVLP